MAPGLKGGVGADGQRWRRVLVATSMLVLCWVLAGFVIAALGRLNTSALAVWVIVGLAFVVYAWTARLQR